MLPEHSRSKLVKLIDRGEVLVEDKVERSSFMLEPDLRIDLPEPNETPAHDLTPAAIPLEVVYEDDDLLVVNKPRGLATHPAASLHEPSLVNALLARPHQLSSAGEDFRPGIVHRLDKETTGLLMVAKTDAAHVALARQIEEKSAERRYFALVAGDVERDRFVIEAPIARDKRNRQKMAVDPYGKRAVSHVQRIHRTDAGYLVAVRLETGRTHQIRVHLAAIAHPVIGDALYAPKDIGQGPLQLHAAYLKFKHPVSQETIECFVSPPDDFGGREYATREQILRLNPVETPIEG
jgi:23S rRNA pseudouridine1911/1915/1917 synthase